MSETLVQHDHIDADRALALAGLLDRAEAPGPGDPLPLMWHLVYFLPRPAQADLGPDGHPRVGFPTAPRPGMRRMFAGGRVRVAGGLRVGDDAVATTRVVSSVDKRGRSGPMRFVTTRMEVAVDGRDVVTDERDIVYLEPATPGAGGTSRPDDDHPTLSAALDGSLAHRRIEIDPVLLFRFSALTYNAHRIHYDLTYARDVEGHAGLVVHGPLQALAMAELSASTRPPLADSTFSYRLLSPLYDGQGMTVVATTDREIAVVDDAGRTTATAAVDRAA